MRLTKVLMTLIVAVLIGVVVLIVVEVANYDGRTPAEKLADERGPILFDHCPKWETVVGEEGESSEGAEGHTVATGPHMARICRYVGGMTEKALHDGEDISELVESLNSLDIPPPPGGEEVIVCGEATAEPEYVVLLRYSGPEEVVVTDDSDGDGCGDTVSNLADEKSYPGDQELRDTLDRLIEDGR